MSDEHNSGEQYTEAAAQVEQTQSDHVQSNQQVPLDALQSERAERQKLQDQVKLMQDHMTLMSSQRQAPAPVKDEMEGISKDDVITYGDLEKIMSKKEHQYQLSIKELKMTQKYPDYQNVVSNYLPEVIRNNPGLRETLEKTQDYELAYYLASNSEGYKSTKKSAKKNADAERIVQNANRAGSLTSIGQNSPISEAKRYKDMSDADFQKQVQKNLGYY